MRDGAEYRSIVKEWAASTPVVRRVWIFGSRARGSAGPTSDLDVAIELSHVEPLDQWIHHAREWRDELQRRLNVKLDLELFDPAGSTPTISKGLAAGSELVYECAS